MTEPAMPSNAITAQIQREADDVSVLCVLAAKPGSPWGFKQVWAELPRMTSDRVRSALTRLAMGGKVEQVQVQDGRGNYRSGEGRGSHTWRVRAPLQED
jgi:hypothetical protein